MEVLLLHVDVNRKQYVKVLGHNDFMFLLPVTHATILVLPRAVTACQKMRKRSGRIFCNSSFEVLNVLTEVNETASHLPPAHPAPVPNPRSAPLSHGPLPTACGTFTPRSQPRDLLKVTGNDVEIPHRQMGSAFVQLRLLLTGKKNKASNSLFYSFLTLLGEL